MGHFNYSFIFLFLFACVLCNKYSKDVNTKSYKDSENVFRTKKLNLIWEKLQRRLNQDNVRKRIYLDFIEIDKDLLASKQIIAEGKDPQGQTATLAEKKLKDVLVRYNVQDILEAFQDRKTRDMYDVDVAQEKRANSVVGHKENVAAFFKDKKLHKLWTEALSAGYSVEELLALKEELTHLQDKMGKYDEATKRETDKEGNSVVNELKMDENKQDLKSLHGQIHEQLKDLSAKIDRDNWDGLNHPKAKELWQAAVKGSFSGKELQDLKEELKHFESRLEKLEFIKNQADVSAQRANKHGKEHLKYSEHTEQERKLKDFSYKVEKLEKYLNSRIHAEL